jgi:hypothetical protein
MKKGRANVTILWLMRPIIGCLQISSCPLRCTSGSQPARCAPAYAPIILRIRAEPIELNNM